MGISKQSIDDLRNRSKISDFILSSTTGKLRGNKGMALCPFHGEKTASMSFTDEDNLFHCFGCKEGGNVITFIQKFKNFSFPETIKYLSNYLGIDFVYEDSKKLNLQNKIFRILSLANDLFELFE